MRITITIGTIFIIRLCENGVKTVPLFSLFCYGLMCFVFGCCVSGGFVETHRVSRFGLTVQRCQADKQTDAGSSPLRFSFPLGRKSCGYCPVTFPLTVNSTCNMANTVALPNAKPFWCRQCDPGYRSSFPASALLWCRSLPTTTLDLNPQILPSSELLL